MPIRSLLRPCGQTALGAFVVVVDPVHEARTGGEYADLALA
jgi:hypothetical protein